MIPNIGQQVKCILRAGAAIEGIVEEWTDKSVQLRSLDGESILIITHPSEDIMLIKIMLEKVEQDDVLSHEQNDAPSEPSNIIQTDLEVKFSEKLSEPSDPENEDRNKSLADLKKEMVEHDRQLIINKLREHRPTGNESKVKYGYPGFMQKPRSK